MTQKLIYPLSRRQLILSGTIGASSLCAPSILRAAINGEICIPDGNGAGIPAYVDEQDFDMVVPEDVPGEKRVYMYNGRTSESFNAVYAVDGAYVPEALEEYNRFCRDWRQNEIKKMHPGLLDIIWNLSQMLDTGTTPWSLTSGYRSPITNAKLDGTAKRSYHMRGMANDLVHPNRSPSKVYTAARKYNRGGVGKYSSFTHVDTGPVRTWG